MTTSNSEDEISVIENGEEEEEKENKDNFKDQFKLEKENAHEKHHIDKNPLKLLRL